MPLSFIYLFISNYEKSLLQDADNILEESLGCTVNKGIIKCIGLYGTGFLNHILSMMLW